MATKKKNNKKNDWSEDLDAEATELKLSDSEIDEDNGSDEETMVPFYGKGKISAFNMLAEHDSDSDDIEKAESISENSDKADEVEGNKQEKGGVNEKNKPNETKAFSKQQTTIKLKEEGKRKGRKGKKGLKEDEDLDALLADLEKPIEKASKEKKKKGAASGISYTAEVPAVDADRDGEIATTETDVGDVMTKKKDKKKKKKGTAEKEKSAEFESPAEGDAVSVENQRVSGYICSVKASDAKEKKKKKKGDSKKDGDKKETKKKKHVDFIKEILRRKQEEEERILREQKEEEERLIAQQKAKEEEERLAKEKREREKQKKKERDEKLKAEGKYLTPAQKEKLRRQQALLANSSMTF
ncbi:unnamed protein product [Onchocerca flexuosa]|uniref:Translation initiation factor IF-2 n=1 Tax=Onchocerca flexuosa TaxID=387005 RepID=A0A183I1P8_9BILA|nr:unnamed protein product [Onchocerca flexuosa]